MAGYLGMQSAANYASQQPFSFSISISNGTHSLTPRVLLIDSSGRCAAYYTYSPITPFTVSSTAIAPTVISPVFIQSWPGAGLMGATIASDGGSTILERGTCWGTISAPTTNCLPEGGLTTGGFLQFRNGIITGVNVYYRGYARNSIGTGYSADGIIPVPSGVAPTVTTPTADSITSTNAVLGANVTDNGGSPIIERGTSLGTSPLPTGNRYNSYSPPTDLMGVFSRTRDNTLAAGTTYHYRGFARNSSGTGWTEDATFTTPIPATPTVPSLFINSGAWTATSIDWEGKVLSAGSDALLDPPIIDRGICWSSSHIPALTLPLPAYCFSEGGRTIGDSFYVKATGLTPATWYYARSYATNNAGVGYSVESSKITRNASVPTVINPTSAFITGTTAVLGGTVSSNGGSPLTSRGTCWQTTAPSGNISSNCLDEGGRTEDVYSHMRTGLPSNTYIYYQPYADNAIGRGYSYVDGFTTTAALPTPTGTLTPGPSCSIVSGQSTCNSSVTWNTTNAVGPWLVDRASGRSLSTFSNSATPFTVTVTYPSTIFDLRDGATLLDSKTILANCSGTDTWNGSICTSAPKIVLTSDKSAVMPGEKVTLTWVITGADQVSCSISSSPVTVQWAGSLTGANVTVGSHNMSNVDVNSATSPTTYSINCGGGVNSSAQVALKFIAGDGMCNTLNGENSSNSPDCPTPTYKEK
jgi:hypothetical protein